MIKRKINSFLAQTIRNTKQKQLWLLNNFWKRFLD
jgi:hypothetical protein